jgi:hypothetical protein
MIGEHQRPLLISQIDPQIAFVTGTSARNRDIRSLRRLSPRESKLP